jgi:hypothetical protein
VVVVVVGGKVVVVVVVVGGGGWVVEGAAVAGGVASWATPVVQAVASSARTMSKVANLDIRGDGTRAAVPEKALRVVQQLFRSGER